MVKKLLDPAYKVDNPSFSRYDPPDLKESGVCDWCAEDSMGQKFYGSTKLEAEKSRDAYNRTK